MSDTRSEALANIKKGWPVITNMDDNLVLRRLRKAGYWHFMGGIFVPPNGAVEMYG